MAQRISSSLPAPGLFERHRSPTELSGSKDIPSTAVLPSSRAGQGTLQPISLPGTLPALKLPAKQDLRAGKEGTKSGPYTDLLRSPEDLAAALAQEDPEGLPVAALIDAMSWTDRDNFARALLQEAGPDWMNRLPGRARMMLIRAVLEGTISDGDNDVFNALSPFAVGVVSSAHPDWVAEADAFIGGEKAAPNPKDGNPDSSMEALAERIATLNPTSPIVELIFRRLSKRDADNLARALYERMGSERLGQLSAGALREILQALREGWISKPDRAAFNALIDTYRSKMLRIARSRLSDPATVARLREILVSTENSTDPDKTVHFGGINFHRMGPRPSSRQRFFDLAYNLASLPANTESVARATGLEPVQIQHGPLHLPGLTVVIPGLGSGSPSADWLFYMARHTDKLVLAYSNADEDDIAVERISEYHGFPVPPELNIYVSGNDRNALRTVGTSSDILLQQLEAMRQSKDLALGTQPLWITPISQGSPAWLLTAIRLQSAGIELPVAGVLGVAPANRGSMISDNHPLGTLLKGSSYLMSGRDGYNAISGLDPDTISRALFGPLGELMISEIDLVLLGLVTNPNKPRRKMFLLHHIDALANSGLDGEGSDGLLGPRSSKGSKKWVEAEKAFDHAAVFQSVEAAENLLRETAVLFDSGALPRKGIVQP